MPKSNQLAVILALLGAFLLWQASCASVASSSSSSSLSSIPSKDNVTDFPTILYKRQEATDLDQEKELGDEPNTRDASECTFLGLSEYSIHGQLTSLFVILGVGAIGVFIPILGYRFKALKPPRLFLELGKFLGVGVILSTAIIHIYASAVDFLSDECVTGVLGGYSGWAGVIFIMAIFIMQFVDFMVLVKYGKHHSSHNHNQQQHLCNEEQITSRQIKENQMHIQTDIISHTHARSCVTEHSDITHPSSRAALNTISVILLEASVVFHSIIIGMTLGLTDSKVLLTLTIAISFHQLFEGFAIGDRLGCTYEEHIKEEYTSWDSSENLNRNRNSICGSKMKSMFLGAFLYSLATPFGQAIGIAVHSSLNTRSPIYLILLGFLEAISAGILVYVVLIHLISEEFSSERFLNFSRCTKTMCFIATYFGAVIMAIVGKWA